jgi:hypothetical protein
VDERLLKQWKATATLLSAAAAEVLDAPGYSEYQDYVEHNELELALNVLEDIGSSTSASATFWWNLRKAAQVMGLKSRYASLRNHFRNASRAAG